MRAYAHRTSVRAQDGNREWRVGEPLAVPRGTRRRRCLWRVLEPVVKDQLANESLTVRSIIVSRRPGFSCFAASNFSARSNL
jgi:hypothetical protein